MGCNRKKGLIKTTIEELSRKLDSFFSYFTFLLTISGVAFLEFNFGKVTHYI